MTDCPIKSTGDHDTCLTILIIEDNPGDADLIRAMLSEAADSGAMPMGFDPHHRETLHEGLEFLAAGGAELVLLDLGLPDSRGLETLQRVLQEAPGVPVIVMTGLDDESVGVAAVKQGAQDYLVKGQVGWKILMRTVHYALERHRLTEELARYNTRLEAALGLIQHDLEIAAQVQHSLLPPADFSHRGVSAAWRFHPSGKLGGDLLNVFSLGEDRVAFYMLDVSGHGVQAALISVSISMMLTNWSSGDNLLVDPAGAVRSPAEVLELLDDRFNMDEETCQYFTITYGIIDTHSRELVYSRAGHTPLLVVAPGGRVEVWTDGGRPIGWPRSINATERRQVLAPGTRIILYSDGIIEAKNKSLNEVFDRRRLLDAVRETAHTDLETCAGCILQKLEQWLGGDDPDDDVSLLILEVS